jgi:PilZ domain
MISEAETSVNGSDSTNRFFLLSAPAHPKMKAGPILIFSRRSGKRAFTKVSQRKESPGMADTTKERRAAPRYALIFLAEVTDRLSSAKFNARTSDVSRTGCYIDMLNPLPRGTQIHLRLQSENEKFESSGTVIYVSPGLGMGVAFAANLPSDEQEILDRWLSVAAKTSG